MRLVSPRRARAIAGALALVTATALASPLSMPDSRAEASTDTPLRIMVVGDSISHGQTGSATWRYWLWRETQRQGVAVQMVGPDPWPNHGRTYEHLDHGFAEQSRHAAIGGSGYAPHIDRIASLVAEYRPDVVLTELGFNDIRAKDPSSAGRTARHALAYTRAVLAADPEVRLVLAQIPGTSLRRPRWRRFTATKNRLIVRADRRIEAKLARLDAARVSRADLRTNRRRPWRPARFTFDGIHPDSTGETLLAQDFADALHRIGELPQRGKVFHREPWQPRPRFNALAHRPGAVVLWWARDAARIAATSYLARVRVDGRFRRFHPRPSGGIVLRLPPGRYAVRMIARRDAMTSRPGPVRWVRVR